MTQLRDKWVSLGRVNRIVFVDGLVEDGDWNRRDRAGVGWRVDGESTGRDNWNWRHLVGVET